MIWDLFLSSFLLSLVLVGVHAYFGREIIRRGIIFADIAVAQFSALGLALSLTLFHGKYSYLLSLSFAFMTSLLIALSQRLRDYSEAFIGLLYALGFSALFLLLSHSPHGVEEIRRLTAGDILLVPLQEALKTALLYSLIGTLLYLRERFLRGFLSEFSLFSLLSLTLASSVSLVGVLVVFSLLVAPALVSLLLGRGLIFSWVWGTFLSLLALSVSFNLDLPAGYSLVFFQALAGFLVFLFKIR
ncbi:MAG: metal ABC transporter permease [Aquificaceae bacterium]